MKRPATKPDAPVPTRALTSPAPISKRPYTASHDNIPQTHTSGRGMIAPVTNSTPESAAKTTAPCRGVSRNALSRPDALTDNRPVRHPVRSNVHPPQIRA